jgi:hypothetical protein
MKIRKMSSRTSFFALALMLGLANVGLMMMPSSVRAQEDDAITGCDGCSKCSGRCEGGIRGNCFCCSGLCWRCGDSC